MKCYDDLEFKPHPIGNGLQAVLMFPNGFGVSVVRFRGSYTRNDTEWEVAILKGIADQWSLCYETPITNDIMGYLSSEEVTNVMICAQIIDDSDLMERGGLPDQNYYNAFDSMRIIYGGN